VEESNIWIIGIVALAIGALIGYLLGRAGANNSEEQQKLEDVQKELDSYKAQVAGHFEETAELVNKMTESYREVYTKLATGAQVLCDAETARSIESTMAPQLTVQKDVEEAPVADETTTEEPEVEAPIEPPRDYAPKKADEAGALSEEYGLKDRNKAESDTDAVSPETEKEVTEKKA